jgi:hypothetical protein
MEMKIKQAQRKITSSVFRFIRNGMDMGLVLKRAVLQKGEYGQQGQRFQTGYSYRGFCYTGGSSGLLLLFQQG